MRILILGAKGMLGQCLVRAFSDCEVLAWDRNDLDVTNAAQVRERIADALRLRSGETGVIINAAAYNAVDRAEEEVERAMAMNGEAVGYIAEAAAEVGARVVHFSTDYVFDGLYSPPPLDLPLPGGGGEIGRGYAEGATTNPLSAYGRSKLLGEQRVQEVAARHPGWRWYIIRTSRLFGQAGSGREAKQSFVDAIVAKATATDRIEAIDEEWSSPTYAPDLAFGTRELLATSHQMLVSHPTPPNPPSSRARGSLSRGRREEGDQTSGIYHRTNNGACTWYGFARVILDTMGWKGTLVPVPVSRYPRVAQRPAHSVLATTKLPPMRGWEKALKVYLGELLAPSCDPRIFEASI